MTDKPIRKLGLTLRQWWHETRSSFWFIPGLIVLGAVGLAAVLIGVDATIDMDVVKRWPLALVPVRLDHVACSRPSQAQ